MGERNPVFVSVCVCMLDGEGSTLHDWDEYTAANCAHFVLNRAVALCEAPVVIRPELGLSSGAKDPLLFSDDFKIMSF